MQGRRGGIAESAGAKDVGDESEDWLEEVQLRVQRGPRARVAGWRFHMRSRGCRSGVGERYWERAGMRSRMGGDGGRAGHGEFA